MSRAERRAEQAQIERDDAADMQLRQETPRRPSLAIAESDACPANMRGGNRHSFGMKGNDGIFRCWYCCRRKPADTVPS